MKVELLQDFYCDFLLDFSTSPNQHLGACTRKPPHPTPPCMCKHIRSRGVGAEFFSVFRQSLQGLPLTYLIYITLEGFKALSSFLLTSGLLHFLYSGLLWRV